MKIIMTFIFLLGLMACGESAKKNEKSTVPVVVVNKSIAECPANEICTVTIHSRRAPFHISFNLKDKAYTGTITLSSFDKAKNLKIFLGRIVCTGGYCMDGEDELSPEQAVLLSRGTGEVTFYTHLKEIYLNSDEIVLITMN